MNRFHMPYPPPALYAWQRLIWSLALVAIVAPLILSPAQAQSNTTVITPQYAASAQMVEGGIVVELQTTFWDENRQYSLEELAALAPNLAFADHSLRGYTALLGLPVGVNATIVEASGAATIIPLPYGVSTLGIEEAVAAPDMARLEGAPFWLREQRSGRLRFWPFQWDRVTREITIRPQIQVRLEFDGELPKLLESRPDPYWEPIYRQVLVNYAAARAWRRPSPAAAAMIEDAVPLLGEIKPQMRIGVTKPGLHRITYADLAAAGVDTASVEPAFLQLYMRRQKIPCFIQGEEDRRLDPGDEIIFYAPPWSSPHTRENVFWLMEGGAPGQRVEHRELTTAGPQLPSYEDVLHLEEQNIYFSQLPMEENADHWFWTSISPDRTGSSRQIVPFELFPVTWGPVNATLRVRVLGKEQGQVSVRIWVNGYQAGEFDVTNQETVIHEAPFPHFLLHDGANEAEIEVIKKGNSVNTIALDWVEVTYIRRLEAVDNKLRFHVDWPGAWYINLGGFDDVPSIWDVSDPKRPVMVDGAEISLTSANLMTAGFISESEGMPTYEVASYSGMPPVSITLFDTNDDLRLFDRQADYLIITPEELRPAAERLAAHRASQGMAVKVATLEAIYNSFHAGVAEPEAIQTFLSYALSVWPAPAPAFALLLGDGHFDPLQNQAQLPIQSPIFPAMVDPWLGEVADENLFAAVVGDDIAPDVMFGRLPVQTLAEAELLVDKLIAYDALPLDAAWRERMLVVADNPDTAGNFHHLADDVVDLAEKRLDVEGFFLGRTHTSAADLRADMLSAWSEGAAYVNYIGHGHPSAWAGEAILVPQALASLQNVERPAFLLSMASLTGVFYNPNARSLQEDLLLLPDGRGVIGYVASTGYGLAVGNALINEGFLNAALYDQASHLGAATVQAKLHLYAQGYSYTEFLTRLYTLIGDPATPIHTPPWEKTLYFPLFVK